MGADAPACAALAGGADVKAFFVRKETKQHGLAAPHRGSAARARRALPDRRGRGDHRRLDPAGDRRGARGRPRGRGRRDGARPAGGRRRAHPRGRRRRALRGAGHDRRRLSRAPRPRRSDRRYRSRRCVTCRRGDWVELAESVPPAAIVTFDRVIQRYPDLELAGLSVERADASTAWSTRATRIVRLVLVALSLILRLLRRPVCGFVRPVDPIERVVRANGLSRCFSRSVGRVWQVDHCESGRSARLVAVFRVTVAARW